VERQNKSLQKAAKEIRQMAAMSVTCQGHKRHPAQGNKGFNMLGEHDSFARSRENAFYNETKTKT
jgi:hypothetical protein